MKRSEIISIVCFYAAIIGLGFAGPFLKKILAEHQRQMEEGFQRLQAAEDLPAPQPQAVSFRPKGKNPVTASRGRALARRTPFRKRLAHGGPPVVHTKAPAGTIPNPGRKTSGPEVDPVG